MQRQRLGQDLAHRHARVQRRIGVLKDDLGVTTKGAQLVGIERAEVAAFETHFSGIRLNQPQHQPAHRGFAATGFADQCQRLAGLDSEADAVDRFDEGGRPAKHRSRSDEMLFQAFDFEQRAHDTSLSSGARMQREA